MAARCLSLGWGSGGSCAGSEVGGCHRGTWPPMPAVRPHISLGMPQTAAKLLAGVSTFVYVWGNCIVFILVHVEDIMHILALSVRDDNCLI